MHGILKFKDELNKTKNENVRLKADILLLKDQIRVLNNDKTFLENYNNRLLYVMKTNGLKK